MFSAADDIQAFCGLLHALAVEVVDSGVGYVVGVDILYRHRFVC